MGYIRWVWRVVVALLLLTWAPDIVHAFVRVLTRDHAPVEPSSRACAAAADETSRSAVARLQMLDEEARASVRLDPLPPSRGPAMHFEDPTNRIIIDGDPRVIGERLARAHAREQAALRRRMGH